MLIGDGVYAALASAASTEPLLAIDADLILRGIAEPQLPGNVTRIDWTELVGLVCAHGPTVSLALMANGDKQIAVDTEGFLRDYRQWTPAAAEQLARAHDITLEENHWSVLHAARAYYDRYQRSPDMRPLVKWVRSTSNQELGNSIALMHSCSPGALRDWSASSPGCRSRQTASSSLLKQ